ncbi:MAG: hypothetical protein QM699_03045 [Amaricoccus sp.]|uniref:hypothetical protein n=1 Tax=Amaricoccus sp. TaxID=1872485 RepID=UPI0039E22C38
MIFVGPNDLAGSIAHLERMLEPEPQALLARIEAFATANGTLLGTICGAGRGWADLHALGCRFVIGPNDVSLIVSGARAAADERDGAISGPRGAERSRPAY